MLGFIFSPLARYAAIGIAVLLAFGWTYREGKKNGAASVRAEIEADNKRRLDRAILADDDARRCANDPACRLQRDQWQRD